MAASVAGSSLWVTAVGSARKTGRRSFVISSSAVSVNVEILEARIDVAGNTGRLDLSDCGLSEVPPSVWKLQNLTDLSLAGNQLTHIPSELSNLKNLRRLGLAGNLLEELPDGMESLESLEGLWLHGNILNSLPSQIGALSQLRLLALSGNQLATLPPSIKHIKNLEVLSVAGNRLEELPEGLGALRKLRVLAAHGNRLHSVAEEIASLDGLQDLWLQGNRIEILPSKGGPKALRQLSLADNRLKYLPPSWGNLPRAETLWLYGNLLEDLPTTLNETKNLKQIWAESNPLDRSSLLAFMSGISHLRALGLDSEQIRCGSQSMVTLPSNVKVGYISNSSTVASGGGYFKIQRWRPANSADVERAQVVVIAFGSAPGVPNWARLLRKVRLNMEQGSTPPAFDVLFVVDPARSWYTHSNLASPGGAGLADHAKKVGSYYESEIGMVTAEYERVLMLGDSMGASAALLFSEMATAVLAFCPQVELVSSAIRPGMALQWQRSFGNSLRTAVQKSSGVVEVHCGSWGHDTDQARLLESPEVCVRIHAVDSHRLAVELDASGELERLVRDAVARELTHVRP